MNEDCEVPAYGEPNPCEDGCLYGAGPPLPPPAPYLARAPPEAPPEDAAPSLLLLLTAVAA